MKLICRQHAGQSASCAVMRSLAREAEGRQDDIEGRASDACEAPKMLQTPRARRFDAVIIENGFLHAHYPVGIAET